MSVVIPAFNEERRLDATLETLLAYLGPRSALEVIVVDDGSADGTATLVDRWARSDDRVRSSGGRPHRGKGHAVRSGFLAANGDLVLVSDADLSTPIEELELLEAALGRGADIAIASRALPSSRLLVRQPRYRELGGRLLNAAIQRLAVPGIQDTQCGFKLFARLATRRCFERQRLDGFGYDVEVLYIARSLKLRIAEVPVRWRHDPDSKVRPLVDGMRLLIDLMRIRVAAARGLYRGAVERAT
ncbi:MAG TPA: dolichyl-phosphate beta-glucosyltransferase [Acidobacteriota bacterium]